MLPESIQRLQNHFTLIPTLAYVVAVVMGLLAARSERRVWLADGTEDAPPRFWLITSLILAGLLIGKVIGLQWIVADLGRKLIRSEGLYLDRRPIQAALIVLIWLVGWVVVWLLVRSRVSTYGRTVLSYISLAALLIFVVIRAVSLHQVDTLLYRLNGIGPWMNLFIEVLLVLHVGFAAFLTIRHSRWLVSVMNKLDT